MTGGPLGAFSYDSQNRLTQAGNIAYTYDAENNRIAIAMGNSTTSYVYDTNATMSRMLVSTDENGNKTYYVYGNGLIGSYDSSNNYAVYHYDYRGSTTALTNSSGQVTDTYTYGTYGNLTSHTGVFPTAFLFNGRDGVQTDSNGLYYMRARYYSPTLLRFVNADTLTGSIQNSETLNRFAYANGNPINFTDPFGRSAEPGNINYKGKNTQAGFLAGFDYFNYILAHRGTSFLYSGIYANWNGAPYQIGFYGGEIGALFMSVAGGIFGGEGIGAEGTAGACDVSEVVGNATKLEVADPSFLDESGRIKWPNNMGFEGKPELISLNKGQIIDRYGNESGSFASPKWTPYGQRALPYIQNETAYHSYEIIKPIKGTQSGRIAAAFNQPGGGTQYLLPDSIENLIENGYLKEIQ